MRWLWLSLLVACKFSNSLTGGTPGDDVMIDAAVDTPPDLPPDAFDPLCFASGGFYVCLPSMPTGDETLDNDNTVSTTTCNGGVNWNVRMMGTTPVCVVAANTISLSGGEISFITGDKPLVILGVSSIQIDGHINASGTGSAGPGGNGSSCNNAGINGTTDAAGGGGGAGGGFGTRGGNAGNGNTNTAGGISTLPLGSPSTILRGGCAGGTGAAGSSAVVGGNGGGAVLLVSRGTITINGFVNVNGEGGSSGVLSKGGGGGGGSGGMIVFHAMTLTIAGTARVVAKGGGGGGGAGNNANGEIGSDPSVTAVATPALGGQDVTSGKSQGGSGAAGGSNATNGMNNVNGGGGGGGGHGQIRVLAGGNNFPNNTASPTPTN